jgi:hypothetical protein
LSSTLCTIWLANSSGRRLVNDPLFALPIGERAIATITAFGMAAPNSGTQVKSDAPILIDSDV